MCNISREMWSQRKEEQSTASNSDMTGGGLEDESE